MAYGGTRRLSLLLAVCCLCTSACGTRWTDAQKAEVARRYERSAETGASADTRAAQPALGATDDSADVDATRADSDPLAPTSASGPTAGAAAAAACTAPSTAPGVNASTVTVGSISSIAGPVPGIGASAAAGARAYVSYRNSIGGVCGRRIVLKEADDGTDNGRYRSVISELGPKVLGIAGGFAVGDIGGADIVRAQALPVVGAPSGGRAAAPPTVFDIFPDYPDRHAVIGKYRWLREQGATRGAIAYLAVDQSRAEANLQRDLMEAAGIKIVLQQELPLSTLSYDSVARQVANSRADYMFFIADINGEANMARALADTGYKLKYPEYYQFAYGTPFSEIAGSAAEGTFAFLRSLPSEEASTNRELATFLKWMDQTAPGTDHDAFAVDSWVAVKAFFDTLESLPGPITRETLLAKLKATDTYDAGGMFGPIRLGPKQTKGCVVGVRFQGGTWRRVVPAVGFLC